MNKLSIEEINKRVEEAHAGNVCIKPDSERILHGERWITAIDKDYGEFEVRIARLIRGCGHKKRGRDNAATTCMERYGVDNVAKLEENKNSLTREAINERLANAGRKCILISDENLQGPGLEFYDEEYGSFFNAVSKVLRGNQDHPMRKGEKAKKTNIERYGGISPLSSSTVREKFENTMMRNHGVKNALQNKELAQKAAKKHKNTSIDFHWKTGEELICEASYEAATVRYLNLHKIEFQWKPDAVILPKMQRVYLPDVIIEGIYVEIKGFMREHSLRKWNEFKELHPTAELWTKQVLINKGILKGEFCDFINIERPVFILSGPPGSGKTTLSIELSKKLEIIEQGKVKNWDTMVKRYCEVKTDIPLLVVCTFKVSTILNRLNSYKLFIILESESTYSERLLSRGGKITPTVMKRHNRLLRISERFNGIIGTYSETKESLLQSL